MYALQFYTYLQKFLRNKGKNNTFTLFGVLYIFIKQLPLFFFKTQKTPEALDERAEATSVKIIFQSLWP